jgi:hypothetical protein
MRKRWKMTLAWLAAMGLSVCLASCSQLDAVKAASTIHAYLPVVMGLAGDAVAMAETVDPAVAPALRAVSAKVQTDLQELETVSGAYAAAPTSDGWASLGATVDTLVNEADQGLLAALAIKDPASQAKAKAALSALDAAVHVLDGYLLAARTPAQVQAAAAQRTVKLESVVRCWSRQDWQRVERAFDGHGVDLHGVDLHGVGSQGVGSVAIGE